MEKSYKDQELFVVQESIHIQKEPSNDMRKIVRQQSRMAISWWENEFENVARVAEGIPRRTQRLKALGNGQVPLVAVSAWQILTDGIL